MSSTRPPIIKKGRLDLTSYDFNHAGPIDLQGAWQFYWHKLYTERDLVGRDNSDQGSYQYAPSHWTSYRVGGEALEGVGYATYRVQVALRHDHHALALYVPEQGTAYRLYVNGRLVASSGTVSDRIDKMRARFMPTPVFLSDSGDTLDIIVQISNNADDKGGMWNAIRLGTHGQILSRYRFLVAVDSCTAGIIFIGAIFAFGLFAFRIRVYASLFLGFSFLSLFVRTIVTGTVLINYILPGIPFGVTYRLEFISVFVLPVALLYTLNGLFPSILSKIVLRFFVVTEAIVTLVTLTTAPLFFTRLLAVSNSLLTLTVIAYVYTLVVAARRGYRGAYYILIGSSISVIAIFHDMLASMGYIYPVYYATYSGVTFFVGHILALSDRVLEMERSEFALATKNKELRTLSITDRLTGLYNRVQLDESLEQELGRSNRYKHPFGLIILDIDRFKQVNDTFGHVVGDAVLKSVATILLATVRDTDVVGRWGGEEFLVICPESDLDGSSSLAEKIRERIEAHSGERIPRVTASFGVVTYQDGEGSQALVERADQALYRSKETGRNRVSRG